MTGPIRIATLAVSLALLSGAGASAASINTPIPYFNRVYGYFADFAPPNLEDLHGATYSCTDYIYRAETPRAGKSYYIKFISDAPQTINAKYYWEVDSSWLQEFLGAEGDDHYIVQLTVHRDSGEWIHSNSWDRANYVYTYRVSEDVRYLLVEKAIKPKTRNAHRDFMDSLGRLPTVPSQVHPDYTIADYFVCRWSSP